MQDKFKVENLNEKIKSLEVFMKQNEDNQQQETVEMEDRIDKRVKKIID